jgi:hypothetical protein
MTTGVMTGFLCWGNTFTGATTTMSFGPDVSHQFSFYDNASSTWRVNSFSAASVKVTADPVQFLWQSSDVEKSATVTASTAQDPLYPRGRTIPLIVVSILAFILLCALVSVFVWYRRTVKRLQGSFSSGRKDTGRVTDTSHDDESRDQPARTGELTGDIELQPAHGTWVGQPVDRRSELASPVPELSNRN